MHDFIMPPASGMCGAIGQISQARQSFVARLCRRAEFCMGRLSWLPMAWQSLSQSRLLLPLLLQCQLPLDAFTHVAPPALLPAVLLRKAAGVESGSGEPNRKKVGKVTMEQVRGTFRLLQLCLAHLLALVCGGQLDRKRVGKVTMEQVPHCASFVLLCLVPI